MTGRGIGLFSVCAVASLALHGVVFGLGDETVGAVSAGAGGADQLSIDASDGTLDALVDAFDAAQAAAKAAAAEPEPLPTEQPVEPAPAPTSDPLPDAVPDAEAIEFELVVPPSALPALPQTPPSQPLDSVKPLPKPERVQQASKPQPKAASKPVARAPRQPAPKSAPAAAPKARVEGQRASGAGSGAYAGNNGTAKASTLSQAQANNLRASWGATIRSRIERRKSYPSGAGRASGQVVVRLSVASNGALAGVSVAKSSGNPALDQAAISAVQRAGKFPAAPKGLTGAQHSFSLSIAFKR
jgi:protein TonB